jgi:hypothetical protein
METLGTFPHCDFQVLHSPGSCSYCDACPIWQALRIVYGINFTGEDDPQKSPCPSARHRPAYQVHRWPGNRPTNAEVPVNPPTSWEHLEGDSDLDD